MLLIGSKNPPVSTEHERTPYRNEMEPRSCLVERFFNQIKLCRPVAAHYDKLAANYLAFFQVASTRRWLRVNGQRPNRNCRGFSRLVSLLTEITFGSGSPLLRFQHKELVCAGFGAPDFALAACELPHAGILVGQREGLEFLGLGSKRRIAFAPQSLTHTASVSSTYTA